MLKAKDIGFEQNWSKEIILPPIHEYKTVWQKQRVIRGYIGAKYSQLLQSILFFLTKIIGEFTGSSRSAFPYGLAAKDSQDIFSTELVPPEGFCLGDPDHLNASDVNALYHHWLG